MAKKKKSHIAGVEISQEKIESPDAEGAEALVESSEEIAECEKEIVQQKEVTKGDEYESHPKFSKFKKEVK